MSPSHAIEARGLVKRFGDLTAVDGLDLAVRPGTCLGLLGPNGAGKTTTIEMLEGLLTPDEGTIEILGRSWKSDPRGIRSRIGVQLQETDLAGKLTAFETLRMFASLYPEPIAPDRVLERVGLVEKRDARLEGLSGGQKQRLTLGCALVHQPEILFLDEPTTGLDPQARRRMWEIVDDFKEAGGTVLLTTHYMEEAERLADELVIVDHGRVIAQGTPRLIIDSLGAESIVELHWNGEDGAPGLDDGALLAVAGVSGLRRDVGSIALTVTHTQESLGGLLELLSREGVELADLHTHRPTLEDVFVSLTGKHLRDG